MNRDIKVLAIVVSIVVLTIGIFISSRNYHPDNSRTPYSVATTSPSQTAQRLADEKQMARLTEESKQITAQGLEEERKNQPALLAGEWLPFTNIPLHFTFLHPKSLGVEGGGGDGYPPATLTAVMVSNIVTPLFSVGSIYEKDVQNLTLKDFAELVRKEQILSASTSPDKQDGPLREIVVDGLPAYQFIYISGTRLTEEAMSLDMWRNITWPISDTHPFVLTEDTRGVKFYIHYNPENPISERIFESFHFVR